MCLARGPSLIFLYSVVGIKCLMVQVLGVHPKLTFIKNEKDYELISIWCLSLQMIFKFDIKIIF